MNSSRKIASIEQCGAEEIQETRRRLLRAAAAAAPLVATLPSGAAYALGSASQCIMDARTESQAVGFNTALTGATPDGFTRVPGHQYTFRKGLVRPPVTLIVFSIGATPNSTYYFGSSGTIGSYPYTVGALFDPATFAGSTWTMVLGPDAVQLLKLYRAASDTGDAYGNPTCAVDCLPASTDPGSQCVFPLSQIGAPDAPGQNPGNNMGLTGSCLASVHPSFSGRSCPQ